MPRPVRLFLFLFFSLLAVRSTQTAYGEDLRALYEQIHAANRIDGTGQAPFYIKIVAQLYNLDGESPEPATVEEWWAAGRYRIEINGPGVKEVQTSDDDSVGLSATRTVFMLRVLLDQSVNPLDNVTDKTAFKSVERLFEGTKFRCISAGLSGGLGDPTAVLQACTAPGSTDLRAVLGGSTSAEVRNQIARFHGIAVALKTSRLYLGKIAVSGEVKALQSFDPTSSPFSEFHGPDLPAGGKDATERPFTAGRLLTQQRPEYPETAEAGRKHGPVILITKISKEGKISELDVLASPSGVLSHAALDAVRNWTFSPFLIDGKPVEVQQLAQVNF